MKEPDLEEEALRASAKGREVTVERQSVSGKALDTAEEKFMQPLVSAR